MRILVVEDDAQVARQIARVLEHAHFVVDKAGSSEIVPEKLQKNEYDLLLLDVSLPGKDGLTLCKELRAEGQNIPILMLTAHDTQLDKVAGLNAGADDYIAKPFGPDELIARIRAVLRRPQQTLTNKLIAGDLELDLVAHTVRRGDELIEVMPKEFALLEYLMRKKGEVLTKNDLLAHVWGVYSNTSSNRLEVYIRYLREKIDDPYENKLIHTVRGAGYKLNVA
jgi:DNA-binding response OmpR family regulator